MNPTPTGADGRAPGLRMFWRQVNDLVWRSSCRRFEIHCLGEDRAAFAAFHKQTRPWNSSPILRSLEQAKKWCEALAPVAIVADGDDFILAPQGEEPPDILPMPATLFPPDDDSDSGEVLTIEVSGPITLPFARAAVVESATPITSGLPEGYQFQLQDYDPLS